MDGFWQDVRFGARLFRKSSGFLAMAVLVPTCVAVFTAALAACYGPARAAARVDPIQTLRAS